MGLLSFLGFGNNKNKVEITDNLIAAAQLAKTELDNKNNYFKTLDNEDFCKKYAVELAQVFACCDTLMSKIPNVLELNKNNFNTQPLIHLLFASADDMFNIIGASDSMRNFANNNEYIFLPDENNIYAFLIADKKIKKQFGVAEVDGKIVNDVMQNILYFENEYFATAMATDLEKLKNKLRLRFVFLLIQKYIKTIEVLKQQKENLRSQIELEKSKLLVNKNLPEITIIQKNVDELDTKYKEISKILTPENQQQELHKFLQNCNSFMSEQNMNYKVNAMGLIYDENIDSNNNEIMELDFPEFTLNFEENNSTNKVGFFVAITKKDIKYCIEKVNAIRSKSRFV